MAESQKIQKGTFAGSYTTPRKPKWIKWALIAVGVLVVLGVAGWFIWQQEMSKRLDKETYEAALERSENLPLEYLEGEARNARFQQCAGITMDAYLERVVKIDNPKKRYDCAKILAGAKEYEESLALYAELLRSDSVDSEWRIGMIEDALDTANFAGNREVHTQAIEQYEEYLRESNYSEDERAIYLDRYGWQNE